MITIVVIAGCIFMLYYFLMLFSFLTGMLGMYKVSSFFRNFASGLFSRVKKVFGIMGENK
jgi:hypothetical protein